MTIYYGGNQIRTLIDMATEQGFELVPFSDTVCGLGSFLLLSPDDQHYNIIVREFYETEWTCKYTVTRRSKVPKLVWKAVEEFENSESSGCL